MTSVRSDLRVAIGGLGAVGLAVARRLDEGIDGLILSAVSAHHRERAEQRISSFNTIVPVLPLEQLAGVADVVVECAPSAVFANVAEPALRAGRLFVPISVGALLQNWAMVDLAVQFGGRIIVPSGALLGLDAVRAAKEGTIHSVRMITRKPPGGLAGAPYLIENSIDLDGLQTPLKVFSGTARQGAVGFPANVNVAAALALAGVGPDQTELEIWADPTITRNTHTIFVDADAARFELKIEGVPSAENPRTGRIVSQSVVSALRGLVCPLLVGV